MILLFVTFIVLLVIKMPVAFAMFASSLLYMTVNGMSYFIAVQRIWVAVDSFPLLAVPGFILAAAIMNTTGVTERIFDFARKCVGWLPGGLGHANVFASVIFAGMSGSAVADAAGLGQIELKAMRDAGYNDEFSLSITAASSTIGPIIPPSVPAVIFGVSAGVSVGRLFAAGFIPGLILAAALSTMIHFVAIRRGYPKEPFPTAIEFGLSLKRAFLPLLAPVLIIAGILGGVFTPTEAAVAAVAYAIVLGIFYRTITPKLLWGFFRDTARIVAPLLFIVCSASLFSWVLAAEQIPQKAAEFFLGTFNDKNTVLLVITVFLLVVGCFMETVAAITILTPILLPIAYGFGIDPVHLGLIVILNLMIGLITPPVGVVLYVLSTLSTLSFEKIAKAVFPYVLVLVAVLLLLTYVPILSLWLPNLVFGVN